jgi:hypothetical protein
MSGVAKDDINPTVPDETVAAVGDAEAGHAEAPVAEPTAAEITAAEIETRARRTAPHLRVVADNEDADFIAPEPASTPAAAEQPGQRIGAVFRATRENLGYSLEQVSKETRVHLSHLRAIEDMTPNLLGAPVYAKGYIRTYARHLGLDENSTLERYLRECAILKDPEKHTIAPPSTGRKLPVALPVFGFLIVALIGAAAAFFLMNGEQPAAPVTAAATPDGVAPAAPAPLVATPGAAEAVAPAAQQLRIVAVRRALIEVRSASGDKYVRRYFDPGESYPVRVGYGWTVTAPEDGSAFEWRLGDQSLGLMQVEPGPAYSQSVDIAAKRTPVDLPPVIDETATAPVVDDAAEIPAGVASPRPAIASPAPSGAPGTRPAATPPSSAGAAPPKPRPAAKPPAPKPQTETPPPAVAAAPSNVPVAPPATPAQDPALLAYPGQ